MKRKFLILTMILVFLFSNTLIFCRTMADSEIPVWNPIESIETSSNGIETNESTAETSSNINDEENPISNAVQTSSDINFQEVEASGDLVETSSENLNTTTIETSNKVESEIKTNGTTVDNNPLELTCGGAILIDQNTGDILYDHKMHEKLRPASVTKVMSILLIMEALDSGTISLTDKVPCTEDAHAMGGSQIWLDTREELTVDEMLKAICVVSANDCTVAMADYLAGSQEAFVERMNEKAKQLGMNDTTFKNCHGIDEDGHLTSPYDIALMSRELLTKHPQIMNYTTIYMDSLRDGKSQLVNTNKLVRNYEGCTGLKTGSTSVALFNLSASATRNGLSLIAVIMRAETTKVRFSEATKLLNYGFSNYQYKELAKANEAVGACTINKGIKNSIDAVCEKDFGITMKKANTDNIEQNVEIYNNIFAPVKKGQKIGEITYTSNDQTLGTVNLVASEDVEKYGFTSMLSSVYKNWFSLLRE